MPRNKQRGVQKKRAKQQAANSLPATDDDNSAADENWSVASVISDNSSCDWGGAESSNHCDGGDTEDERSQDLFLDQLLEAIDGLFAKSGPHRKKHLQHIQQALTKRLVWDFLDRRKETLVDCLLKCLKRGGEEERGLSVRCLSLLAVQLGPDLGNLCLDVERALSAVVMDSASQDLCRAECASSLVLCCLVTSDPKFCNVKELMLTMKLMEAEFRKAYRREDGTMPRRAGGVMAALPVACLYAWGLLLTCLPDFAIRNIASSHLTHLVDLLHSESSDLRITAGETIALLCDLNHGIDEDVFAADDDCRQVLCDHLRALATESSKHVARSTLRHQRSRFRDILQTVEDLNVKEEEVSICDTETVVLDSWSAKVQYRSLCRALQSGVFFHLKENMVVRSLFSLGLPCCTVSKVDARQSKLCRKYHNIQADKARTLSRTKNRIKRNALIMY